VRRDEGGEAERGGRELFDLRLSSTLRKGDRKRGDRGRFEATISQKKKPGAAKGEPAGE